MTASSIMSPVIAHDTMTVRTARLDRGGRA